MELTIALPGLLVIFAFTLIGGFMAEIFGRKFWPWLFISMLLPVVSCMILLCLPDKADHTNQKK